MHIDEDGMAAAGHRTSPVIASHHSTPRCRRHVLGRPIGTDVGREVLCVAGRHCHDLGFDGDELAGRLLEGLLAPIAGGDGDLIARAPVLIRATQNLTRQEEQQRVIVERGITLPAKVCGRVAKKSERFGVYLEAQDVKLRVGACRIGRSVSGLSSSDHALELSSGLAPSRTQPLLFGVRRRDPTELTRGGPMDFTGAEGALDLRQPLESLRYPEFLLGLARAVAATRLRPSRARPPPWQCASALHVPSPSHALRPPSRIARRVDLPRGCDGESDIQTTREGGWRRRLSKLEMAATYLSRGCALLDHPEIWMLEPGAKQAGVAVVRRAEEPSNRFIGRGEQYPIESLWVRDADRV